MKNSLHCLIALSFLLTETVNVGAQLPHSNFQERVRARQVECLNFDVTFDCRESYAIGYFSKTLTLPQKKSTGTFPPQETKTRSQNRITFRGDRILFHSHRAMWSEEKAAPVDADQKDVSKDGRSQNLIFVENVPAGKINSRAQLDDLHLLRVLPITLTARGADPHVSPFSIEKLNTTHRVAPIDGRACIEFELKAGGLNLFRFWFDAGRDYTLRRATLELKGKVVQRVNVKSVRTFGTTVIPDHWIYEEFDDRGYLLTNADYDIVTVGSEPADDRTFEIEYPKGAQVYDDLTGKLFVSDGLGGLTPFRLPHDSSPVFSFRRIVVMLAMATIGIILAVIAHRRLSGTRSTKTTTTS